MVIAVFVITFIIQAFQIPSESMENTLLIGDYLLVDKLCYGGGRFLDPHPAVSARYIAGISWFSTIRLHPNEHFVKRVVGVPGDRLRLINQQVYVNGVLPDWSPTSTTVGCSMMFFAMISPAWIFRIRAGRADWWLQMKKLVEDGQLIVPEGHYFVLGDQSG